MQYYVLEWTRYMEGTGSMVGLVSAVAGMCFVLYGWRMYEVALLLVYGAVGAGVGASLAPQSVPVAVTATAGVLVFVGVGVALRKYAAPMLAGSVAALIAWYVLAPTSVPSPTTYIVMALACVAVMTVSMSNLRGCTIAVTAFIGAILVVSGLVALVADSRALFPHYRNMRAFGLFIPFLLLVPTVCGILLQMADAQGKDHPST
jgi:hypothetical protein